MDGYPISAKNELKKKYFSEKKYFLEKKYFFLIHFEH